MRGLRLFMRAAAAGGLACGAVALTGAVPAAYAGPDSGAKPAPEAAPKATASPGSAEPSKMRGFETAVTKPGDIARPASAAAQIPHPDLKKPPAPKLPPARDLFGAAKEPANMAARSIGFYAKGCLAGAKPLPVDGPGWQAMRLSRNRMWGHPSLVTYIEQFAKDAKEKDGWPGLLVGDLSMPRGGPMPYGHASHQVGLDVDIWYRPAPDRRLSAEERENIPMESFLLDPGHVNPAVWTPEFVKLLRRAVAYPEVARVFVNPAIKKWLCDTVKEDRAFLKKITPIHGHDEHFHVRLLCPAGDPGCQNQVFPAEDGCGKGLDKWIEGLMKPKVPAAPPPAAPKPAQANGAARPGITMKELPNDCAAVLQAPALTAASAP
jgi:penicillin-insensitive murein DD-endopeptidase